jgi:ribonuclease D
MDRQAEARLAALKHWRAGRAAELGMDPGVLCPNSALEAIAWRAPSTKTEVERIDELKRWFVREFASEVIRASEGKPAG